jgi:enoyl-CoA hydratase
MSTVLLETAARRHLRTLNRPDRLNAMSHELVADVHAALDAVAADPSRRVLVITGAGCGLRRPRFEAGAARRRRVGRPGDRPRRPAAHRPARPHLRSLQPVIAGQRPGGGGLALALASDIRIGDISPVQRRFVRIGSSGCDIGVSWLLPRHRGLAGVGATSPAVSSTPRSPSASALSSGSPDGEVVDAAPETAALIAANSPLGVWMTKDHVANRGRFAARRHRSENRTQILTSFSADMREAMTASSRSARPTSPAGEPGAHGSTTGSRPGAASG